MLSLPCILIAAATATSIWIQASLLTKYYRKKSLHHGYRAPRREDHLDILGIRKAMELKDHFRRRTMFTYMLGLFKRYGDTYISNVASRDIIFTSNVENISHILNAKFSDYDSAAVRPMLKHATGNGIIALDGPEWRSTRELFRNQFSNNRAITDLEMHERSVQNLINCIPDGGNPVDMQELFPRLVLDLISGFALGDSVDSLSPHQSMEKKEFAAALCFTKDMIALKGFFGPLHWLIGGLKFYRACDLIRRHAERYASQALNQQLLHIAENPEQDEYPKDYSFIRGLTRNRVEFSQVQDQTLSILIAGIDTVASLLSETFWLLSRHQRIYHKLRSCILDRIGTRPPTYEEIKQLPYLRHVIAEVLRLYPPVPFDGRRANKDTTLPSGGGIDGTSSIIVEKGQIVVFSSYAVHHNDNIYHNPHEFRPERWENQKLTTSGYIPFSNGPRSCPGQQYALTQASYIIIRLIQTYSAIKSHDSDGWREKIMLSLQNDNGVVIGFSRE